MIPDGTTAIRNMQTGAIIPTQLGECRPSECDLREHEEIVVRKDGAWIRAEDSEPTAEELRDIRIMSLAQEIIELIEDKYK
jgi:hypothetical protein